MNTTGIASVPGHGTAGPPEAEGVFLCESLDDVEFFVGFGQHPLVDVWQVETHDLPLEPGPDGWLLCRRPIGTDRLLLVQRDRPPESRPLSSVAIVFMSASLGRAEMTRIAGIPPDRTENDDGDAVGLKAGQRCTYWMLEGDDRYAPIEKQAAALIERIRAAETGLARLAAACDTTRFTGYTESERWQPPTEVVELLQRIGADIGW